MVDQQSQIKDLLETLRKLDFVDQVRQSLEKYQEGFTYLQNFKDKPEEFVIMDYSKLDYGHEKIADSMKQIESVIIKTNEFSKQMFIDYIRSQNKLTEPTEKDDNYNYFGGLDEQKKKSGHGFYEDSEYLYSGNWEKGNHNGEGCLINFSDREFEFHHGTFKPDSKTFSLHGGVSIINKETHLVIIIGDNQGSGQFIDGLYIYLDKQQKKLNISYGKLNNFKRDGPTVSLELHSSDNFDFQIGEGNYTGGVKSGEHIEYHYKNHLLFLEYNKEKVSPNDSKQSIVQTSLNGKSSIFIGKILLNNEDSKLKISKKEGFLIYSSGHVYLGYFENREGRTVKEGSSSIYLIKSGADAQLFEGIFENDQFVEGKIKFWNNKEFVPLFEGRLLNNEPSIGKYWYQNKEVYEGAFKNNFRDGVGTYHYANGSIYSGFWREGKRNGKGLYKTCESDKGIEYEWENDKIKENSSE